MRTRFKIIGIVFATFLMSFVLNHKSVNNFNSHSTKKNEAINYDLKKISFLKILGISIQVEFGHNDVVDGQRYECIRRGICKIRVEVKKSATWTPIKLDEINIKEPKISISPKNGKVYLLLPKDHDEIERILPEYTIKSKTFIEPYLIKKVNEELKRLELKPFKQPREGTKVKPILYNDIVLVPLN